MPPKPKKSVSLWQACEKCGVILTARDLQIHVDNSCDIDTKTSVIHGFIKDSVIINSVEEFHSDEGMKYLHPGESTYYVYLSESAMQLCDIVIGGNALIKSPNGTIVRTAWPMYERTLTSIMMTEEGLVTLGVKVGTRLSVEKLPVLPIAAASVIIQPLSPLVADNFTVPVLSFISKSFLGKVILEGNKLSARHYGQKLFFQVSKCCVEDEDNVWAENEDEIHKVVESVNKLHIADQCKVVPYCVNVGTKFKLVKSSVKPRKVLSLSLVGGLKDIIKKLKEFMDMVWNPEYSTLGVQHGHGCLLFGPPGTGKTMLVKALASETSVTFIEILGSEVYSKYVGEAETRLRGYFALAKERAPSLVFLDEVDALCPQNVDSLRHQEQRISATLLTLLDSLSEDDGGGVVVIGATSRPMAMDPRLRRPGRLELELELPVPDPAQRLDILQRIVSQWEDGVRLGDGVALEKLAQVTHGHVGADLACICAQAVSSAVRRKGEGVEGGVVVGEKDMDEASLQVTPSAMREVMVEVPNVRWSDIGGQHDLKLKLRQAVEWPLKHPEAFERLGISPPKGLLMFGPPGCSKTMIAKAIATESGLNFISIKGPELFSKWVGESERAVREVFRRARQVAPAVVFFDELDALGGERGSREGSGGSLVQERVLAQLLTEMDGVTPLSQVTIVAATNRPDRIDKALLRPGRLDQIVYVPLPDTSTRRDILTKQFDKSRFAPDVSLEEIIERTQGFSGAEVVAVCQEAGLNALEEDIQSEHIEKHHVEKALKNVQPRTSQYLLDLYENYTN